MKSDIEFPLDFASVYRRTLSPLARETFFAGVGAELGNRCITSGRVLDLGAGLGESPSWLATFGDFEVYAIEPCKRMRESSAIPISRHFDWKKGLGNLRFRGFDVVFSNFDTFNLIAPLEVTAFLIWLAELEHRPSLVIFDIVAEPTFPIHETRQEASGLSLSTSVKQEGYSQVIMTVSLRKGKKELWSKVQSFYPHTVKSLSEIAVRSDWKLTSQRPFSPELDSVEKLCITLEPVHR